MAIITLIWITKISQLAIGLKPQITRDNMQYGWKALALGFTFHKLT